MLARGVHVLPTKDGPVLQGLSPPLGLPECKQLWSKSVAERHAAVKELRLVCGVPEFVAMTSAVPFSLDVARYWQHEQAAQSAPEQFERISAVLASLERCQRCRELGLACSAFCLTCESKRQLCDPCVISEIPHWSFLRRPCSSCKAERRAGGHCVCTRVACILAISDQGPENVGAFNKIESALKSNNWRHLARPMRDFHHLARSDRNSSASWFLFRDGQCVGMALINALLAGPDKEISDKLLAAASQVAWLHKDKHSMVDSLNVRALIDLCLAQDNVMRAFRQDCIDGVALAHSILLTLAPERYRKWKQESETPDLDGVRFILHVRNGNLYISGTTCLYRVVLHYPIRLSIVAGSSTPPAFSKPRPRSNRRDSPSWVAQPSCRTSLAGCG